MIITTHKQFPNYKRYEIEYEGRPLVMETGKLAELCNSAVLVSYGETTVLVTCTASARPKDGVDYFPLSVDFNEKLYAVGRIPGSFMRREGKPSLPAVLASRLIDRPMRPLFPSDLRNDVIIACEVLSVDRDCSPEITAMIGASAAVSISDVPFNGPIAGIVLGWDGEKYLFNPTQEQRKTNRMITTIAATHKKIVMIESEADQVPDDVMYEGIVQAHAHLQPVLDLIDKMVSEIGKPKFEYEHHDIDHDLFDKLDAGRVEQLIRLVSEDSFGQIVITDCNPTRLRRILDKAGGAYSLFTVENGGIGQETATAGAPACGGQLPAEESTKEAADRTRHAGPQEAGSAEGIRTAAVQGEVSEDLRNAASAGEKSGGQDACVTDTADKTSDGKEGAR